ncbi:MAG: glycosyltransferase [bacterium]
MKVLMFGWEFPPIISGGLGTVCKALTQHLAQIGVNVCFVMPRVLGEKPQMSNFELLGANEITFHETVQKIYQNLSSETLQFLEVDAFLHPYLNQTTYQEKISEFMRKRFHMGKNLEVVGAEQLNFQGGYGRDLLSEVSRYALVGNLMGLRQDFDVIHAHDWICFPAAVEAKKASGKPLICHVHATEFDRTGGHPNQEVYNIERYGVENADLVFAVSQRTKDTIAFHYGIDPQKIRVVYNAVSKEKQVERVDIKKHLKEKIVLFLGRVTIQKGPDYFVEAAHKVLQKVKNVRFVMAGSGDMLPRLIERIAYYRMQKNFHFTGFLRGKEVEEMFAMSDLYVMPSVSEPFGVTPFEAMLYHVPVIISKQSGIAEILQSGIKLDFWDVDKLADNIVSILTDDDLARKLIEEGAQELDHVSWDTAAHKVKGYYHEVIQS